MVVIAIGLWTLSYAVPAAVYWVVYLGTYSMQGVELGPILQDRWAALASTATQIVIGFWLLFGAKAFATYRFHLRTAGVRS